MVSQPPKHKSSNPEAWMTWVASLSDAQKEEVNREHQNANSTKVQIWEAAASRPGTGESDQVLSALLRTLSLVSLILVQDNGGSGGEEDGHPRTPLPNKISLDNLDTSNLSPGSAAVYRAYQEFKWHLFQEKGDEQTSELLATKQPRVLKSTDDEVEVQPGESIQLGMFHKELFTLFDNNQYIPITLFTPKEHKLLLQKGDWLPKMKLDSKHQQNSMTV
ncbi:hypothetical protein GLOTRDRAFT_126047 [Gloeophyllum trabeum ATCC 11539]|uniref:Uncharacterized protein n=1 Tax=Gloeophyllum trabeum (strain ATCC 11539 / FP-39264 / Madison 617) TaxID=670483 RepID=S7RXT8_GLOTA|nr:uncharacterized protein GLOTRDRAFT_126047 [Gloeophyllum trabeum ATCC 11539]EPQ59750.1 hypothetical protein GLOTRDRAFT_126047 [Gloeophyllum trabeum ATCC 11539]